MRPARLHATTRRNIAISALFSCAVLAVLIAIIQPWKKPDRGWLLWSGNPPPEKAWETLNLLLDANLSLLQLAIGGIGVIAFLLSYNRERRGQLPARAWIALPAALVAFVGCVVFALLGRELLLMSIIWGIVAPKMHGLLFARWGYYLCLLIGGLLVALFGFEVALAPSPGENEALKDGLPGG